MRTLRGLSKLAAITGIALGLASARPSYAQNAVISTVPEETLPGVARWERGSNYRLDVYLDNTGLNGEATKGAQWRLNGAGHFSGMSFDKPSPPEDFWNGSPMFFEFLANLNDLSARLAENGYAVANQVGKLQWYDINVSPTAPLGQNSFSLSDIEIINESGTALQPYTIQNNPVEIVPAKGDANLDGLIGVEDAAAFTDVLLGSNTDQYSVYATDMNNDGSTNGEDIQPFINKLLGQ